MDDLYYSDYIQLDAILNSQHPRSFEKMEDGNDEMLFIVIHQAYELWFKQIIFELDLVRNIFVQDRINENSPDMSNAVHKLKRIVKILELLNQQVSVLETITALDFLEFRNYLLPAWHGAKALRDLHERTVYQIQPVVRVHCLISLPDI